MVGLEEIRKGFVRGIFRTSSKRSPIAPLSAQR
jgi:hypothetical protein